MFLRGLDALRSGRVERADLDLACHSPARARLHLVRQAAEISGIGIAATGVDLDIGGTAWIDAECCARSEQWQTSIFAAASHSAMSSVPIATHRSPCPPGFSPFIIAAQALGSTSPACRNRQTVRISRWQIVPSTKSRSRDGCLTHDVRVRQRCSSKPGRSSDRVSTDVDRLLRDPDDAQPPPRQALCARFSRSKPSARSVFRSSTSSSPIWTRSSCLPLGHGTAVRYWSGWAGIIRLS